MSADRRNKVVGIRENKGSKFKNQSGGEWRIITQTFCGSDG